MLTLSCGNAVSDGRRCLVASCDLRYISAYPKALNNRVELRDLLPALATAAGAAVKDNRSGVQLSDWVHIQRSRFMRLAAVFSGRKQGVWKVGDGHIEDLLTKKANVQMTGINIVSRKDFNDEFAVWQRG